MTIAKYLVQENGGMFLNPATQQRIAVYTLDRSLQATYPDHWRVLLDGTIPHSLTLLLTTADTVCLLETGNYRYAVEWFPDSASYRYLIPLD